VAAEARREQAAEYGHSERNAPGTESVAGVIDSPMPRPPISMAMNLFRIRRSIRLPAASG